MALPPPPPLPPYPSSSWACENNRTLTDLKEICGFKGWVMSDWGATHSTIPAALSGLDQQMPDNTFFGPALAEAVANGTVPESRIDDMVMRMLTPMYALGLFSNPPTPDRNIQANASSAAHNDLARRLAEKSITLLKNSNNLLPLDPTAVKSVAVLGDVTTVTGGGSGGVVLPYVITPQQGISALLGPGVTVTYLDGTNLAAAVAAAQAADVAIVVVATTSHEGADRVNLSLPLYQDELAAAVAAAQPKTVVVARCPGACVMPWAPQVPSILFQLMPGQEAGSALATTLFGFNNPSGKLPISFPNSMNDTWLSLVPGGPVNPMQYPGTDRGRGFPEADYTEEGAYGYRFFDIQGTDPLWPFGHGLSYSTFTYSGLTVSGTVSATTTATITATISNTGAVDGAEVAQLYIGFPAAAGEPPKLLKGFQKVFVTAGYQTTVSFTLNAQTLSWWDVVPDAWSLLPGTYTVFVGSSSRDIRLTGTLTVA
jgi:beta-glucosidase